MTLLLEELLGDLDLWVSLTQFIYQSDQPVLFGGKGAGPASFLPFPVEVGLSGSVPRSVCSAPIRMSGGRTPYSATAASVRPWGRPRTTSTPATSPRSSIVARSLTSPSTPAAQAAVAVDNARRFESERRRAEELESAGYDGWYVLEQDAAFDIEPAPGAGPLVDARASVDFLRSLSSS